EQYLAQLLSERGRLEEAMQHVERAREITLRSGGSMWYGPLAATRASIELWAGTPDAAAATVRECLDDVEGAEYAFAMAHVYAVGMRAAADIAQRDQSTREREADGARGLIARFGTLLDGLTGVPPARAVATRAACAAELARLTGEPAAPLWGEAKGLWDE